MSSAMAITDSIERWMFRHACSVRGKTAPRLSAEETLRRREVWLFLLRALVMAAVSIGLLLAAYGALMRLGTP